MANVQVLNISGVGATKDLKIGLLVTGNEHCVVPELRNKPLTVVAYPSSREPDKIKARHRVEVLCFVDGKPRLYDINVGGLKIKGSKPEPPQKGMFVITCPKNSKGLEVKLAKIERSWLHCQLNEPLTRLLEVKFGENEPTCKVELRKDVVFVPVPESFAAQFGM